MHLVIETNALISSAFGKILAASFFKNVLVSPLIFSAFSQILTVVLKSSLVHLVIETNALIFSVSS